MALVSYSDSEGSDTEQAPAPLPRSTKEGPPAVAPKSSFQKVVNRAEPHKIRVNLAALSSTSEEGTSGGDDLENDRPPKRAKTASAFSGFNSFLPAPKNNTKPAMKNPGNTGTSLLARNRGSGLGQGISLKTGPAPAFSREAPPAQTYDDVQGPYDEYGSSTTQPYAQPSTNERLPVQQSTPEAPKAMFRPLSVARKPPKKKTAVANTNGVDASSVKSEEQKQSANATNGSKSAMPTSKPKQPLFSTFSDDSLVVAPSCDNTQYEPEFSDPVAEEKLDSLRTANDEATNGSNASFSALGSTTKTNDLQALADNLGLTSAQRRQLFGRNGAPDAAQVTSFSLAAEYSHNNALRESEAAAPAHNPVRAIAPGKHSLQQLVNAATSQKDALEESFASGRRNKQEAGSKYGW